MISGAAWWRTRYFRLPRRPSLQSCCSRFITPQTTAAIQAFPPSPKPPDAAAARPFPPLQNLRPPAGSPSKARKEEGQTVLIVTVLTLKECRRLHPVPVQTSAP